MATVTTEERTIWTIGDLLKRFGPIPANRIRTDPPPGLATEQDVIDIEARENRLCELVDGVLVEKTMGMYESRVASVLGHFIEAYLEENDIGATVGADGMMKILPGQIRIPDLSFMLWDELPDREFPKTPVPELTPALAVEVLSEGNTEEEMKNKLREYFQSGTCLVWYVDPTARTVRVYTSPRHSNLVKENGTLDGGNVLPGFSLPLKKLFARVERGAKR